MIGSSACSKNSKEPMAERVANERLKRDDPAAYEAKMLCLCGETFKGYDPQRPPRATRATGTIALPERFREWAP